MGAVAALLPVTPLPPAPVLFRCVVRAVLGAGGGPGPSGRNRRSVVDGADGDPDPGRVLRLERRRRMVAVDRSDPGHPARLRPPVATLIATTAYQRGNVVLAQLATDHALTVDPGYGLARLMHAAIAPTCTPT